jgi:hypothetical protein
MLSIYKKVLFGKTAKVKEGSRKLHHEQGLFVTSAAEVPDNHQICSRYNAVDDRMRHVFAIPHLEAGLLTAPAKPLPLPLPGCIVSRRLLRHSADQKNPVEITRNSGSMGQRQGGAEKKEYPTIPPSWKVLVHSKGTALFRRRVASRHVQYSIR